MCGRVPDTPRIRAAARFQRKERRDRRELRMLCSALSGGSSKGGRPRCTATRNCWPLSAPIARAGRSTCRGACHRKSAAKRATGFWPRSGSGKSLPNPGLSPRAWLIPYASGGVKKVACHSHSAWRLHVSCSRAEAIPCRLQASGYGLPFRRDPVNCCWNRWGLRSALRTACSTWKRRPITSALRWTVPPVLNHSRLKLHPDRHFLLHPGLSTVRVAKSRHGVFSVER